MYPAKNLAMKFANIAQMFHLILQSFQTQIILRVEIRKLAHHLSQVTFEWIITSWTLNYIINSFQLLIFGME